MIEIRKIRHDEIEKAEALMHAAFPKSYSSIFFLYEEHTIVASDGDRIVGGINMDVYDAGIRTGYIGWLYVDAEYRGMGIAGKLIDKAEEYLYGIGCREIALCIEGDNPSSFSNFSRRGYSIMTFPEQVRVFGISFLKVWKRASRFFDRGYFMWHKGNVRSLEKGFRETLPSFILMLMLNTLLFIPVLLKTGNMSVVYTMIPSAALILRSMMLYLALRIQKRDAIFLSWDTSYFVSIISSLLLPMLFPSPGGVYIKGDRWSMAKEKDELGNAALAAVAAEASALIVFMGTPYLLFALPLFIADTLLPFYPFCGFQASRLRRRKDYPLIAFSAAAVSIVSVLSLLLE